MNFPRFRGHPILYIRGVCHGQVQDSEQIEAVPSGIPSSACGATPGRPADLRSLARIRCVPLGDQLLVKQADRDAGRGDGGLTTAEREELVRLRRENRQLKIEREILATATTWLANQETTRSPKRSSDS